jgi:hypothetical protein
MDREKEDRGVINIGRKKDIDLEDRGTRIVREENDRERRTDREDEDRERRIDRDYKDRERLESPIVPKRTRGYY